ncbi:xaa-Pro dipeptidase-like [Oratosquilla oratoria]|uniref:xaa-Pro dipeptidase-like n=1 Tax=Oratosquilla oratoria TaxID=337810 RepID=UPI003F762A1F
MASAGNKKPAEPRYADGAAHFDMGEHTLRVPMTLHKENRSRLSAALQKNGVAKGSWVILQGGEDSSRYSSDMEHIFRQESYFHWAFGVLEPGWFGAFEVDTGRTILFCPRFPASYATWMGRIVPPEEFRERYQVDEVHHVDEVSIDRSQNLCRDALDPMMQAGDACCRRAGDCSPDVGPSGE